MFYQPYKDDTAETEIETHEQHLEKKRRFSNASDTTKIGTPYDTVERWRRFLAFRLAIDYDVPLEARDQIQFTQDDLRHFLTLALHCFLATDGKPSLISPHCLDYRTPGDVLVCQSRSLEGKGIKQPKAFDTQVSDALIQTEIVEPAKALGVPCSVIVTILRMLMASIYFVGYSSTIIHLVKDTCLDNLAAKFIMDKTILLEAAMVPSMATFRKLLQSHITEKQNYYFERLESPLDYKVASTYWTRSLLSKEERCRKDGCEDRKYLSLYWDCKRASRMIKCLSPPHKSDSWVTKILRHFTKPKAKSWLYLDERPGRKRKS